MIVKALTAFTDKETGIFRKLGDSFSCSAERAKELTEKKAAEIIEDDAPVEKKPAKKPVTKKK